MRKMIARWTPETVPLKYAIWDYLIWGDAAFAVAEIAIRKLLPMAFFMTPTLLKLILFIVVICHAIYLMSALRLVYVSRSQSRSAVAPLMVPLLVLIYAVLCLYTFLTYRVLSPVSFVTLHFVTAALRWLHV